MELLIPGLILVALMVYASTKIKRISAEAFQPERVETECFVIEKPEGFLNVLNRDPSLELDAYSKEFGVDDAANFRAARVELRVYDNRTVDYAANALAEAVTVTSNVAEVIDGRKYRVLEAEMLDNGVGFRELYKLAEKDGRVFELKVAMIADADASVVAKAEQMLASFEIK